MKQIDRHQVREHTEYGIPVLNEDYDELPDCNCSALAQRVGELEDWKKITDTAGKKLAEDNIRLRKALENVRKAQGDCMCHHVQGKCIKCIADEALKEV